MTTALATTETRDLVHSTGAIDTGYVRALIEYAEVIFKGGLGGKDCKRMEEVAAKIELGRQIGLNAFMSISSIAVMNGRPSIYGDAALALVRSKGVLEDFEEFFEGEGDSLTAVCRVKRKGAARERVERFSVADAKKANLWGKKGPWTEYTRRQLMFRARSFCLRDEFGDVLSGMILTEEAMDYPVEPRNAAPMQVSTVPPPAIPAEQPAALPAAPTREERLQHLAHARAVAFAALGVADDEAASAKWAEILAPFGGVKASQLDDAKLEELIVAVEKLADPSHGRSGT